MAIFRKNGNFYIDYYVGGRRVREKVGPSKGEAQRALALRRAEIIQGRFQLQPQRSVPTFEQLARLYRDFAKVNKRGFYNERYRIEMLVRFFAARRLSDLTAWDAEKFKVERARQVQPATVNRDLGNLKHMMTMAVKWGYLAKNPFSGVKPLPVSKMPDRILSVEEEGLLLAACERVRAPYLRPIILLALNTGMRKGEILSLQWSQIDFSSRLINIYNGKSKNAERRIPMNETVYKLLSDLLQKRRGDLVFPSHRNPGHRLRDHKMGFWKAVREAGIPHIRFHDLRHTFATRLVRAGVDLITVQHLLGHGNITMTARYAHALEDDKIAAVRRLERAAAGQPVPNRPPAADSLALSEAGNLSEISAVGV